MIVSPSPTVAAAGSNRDVRSVPKSDMAPMVLDQGPTCHRMHVFKKSNPQGGTLSTKPSGELSCQGLLIGVFALMIGALPAQADIYTFKVKSLHPYAVQIKFYSQTRQGHQWPSVSRAWALRDDDTHALKMSCNSGEKICWGAWVNSKNPDRTEWGAGTGSTDGCKGCCFTCANDESRGIITLKMQRASRYGAPAPVWVVDATPPPRPPRPQNIENDPPPPRPASGRVKLDDSQ